MNTPDRPAQPDELSLPESIKQCESTFCNGYYNENDREDTDAIPAAGLEVCNCPQEGE